MNLREEIADKARQNTKFDINKFQKYLKDCFEHNSYTSVTINFDGHSLYSCGKWIECPVPYKQDVINFISANGFSYDKSMTMHKTEQIIVRIF